MSATYGFLSTYPPTQCGLATFNAALATHLNVGAGGNGVVRLLAGGDHDGLTADRMVDDYLRVYRKVIR